MFAKSVHPSTTKLFRKKTMSYYSGRPVKYPINIATGMKHYLRVLFVVRGKYLVILFHGTFQSCDRTSGQKYYPPRFRFLGPISAQVGICDGLLTGTYYADRLG